MKRAKLSLEEIVQEINSRTNLPCTGIRKVLMAYKDIAREAIKSGVECQLLDIGTLTWTVVPPTKRAEFRNWFKSRNGLGDWIVKENLDGYNRPLIRFFNSYKADIKQATLVPYSDSENSMGEEE